MRFGRLGKIKLTMLMIMYNALTVRHPGQLICNLDNPIIEHGLEYSDTSKKLTTPYRPYGTLYPEMLGVTESPSSTERGGVPKMGGE
jgi:hypothetical protein